ncbi:META domain-containing protein [Streptomyces sp. SID12501]|uniref:META domain-containing protein n=1 Tax=Streptomyces sp. SID12501 TaxID=2706042 RepID=A0A6B3C1I8_9ACTN|nr:META domain-containing protein [Streptomyces sp. SID12501]NEC90509.1 META domain-containing protein [Streptomyces sp. SID12501]
MKKQRLTSVSLSILTLAVLPLAAACGSEKDGGGSQTVGTGTGTGAGSGTSEVTGVHWTVNDLTADGKKSEAPASAWLKIDKNGQVSGNLGCNGFGADATVDGDGISFAQFLSTDMACANDPMTFESNLTKALKDGTLTAQVKGDDEEQLTLTSEAGTTIHLTEEKAAALSGTKWTVTTLGDTNTVSPLPSAAEAYLVFDQKKGTVSGKAGCNNVSAEATVSDGNITFGSPATTRRMCDGSLMETEKAFLKIFDGRTAYKIDHRSLSLTSANGTTVSANAAD